MVPPQNMAADTTTPAPFPEGWYFLTSRRAVLKAKLLQKTWMGQKIVIWCDENERICVAGAVCPHLGADLCPDAGGRVRDGRLVCPFHGFEYDTAGQCVATPYAPPPKSARLQVFETTEIAGLIFAWWGIGGREPQWNLPEAQPEQTGWSNLEIQTLRFPGHPQETAENSVDMAHFRYIHGYDEVIRIEPVSVDGPRLMSRFDFKTTRKIARTVTLALDLAVNTHVYGLGYSFVEVHERSIPMDMRVWILSTPIDGTLVDLSLVSQVREIRKPARWLAGFGFLPPRLRSPVMSKFMAVLQKQDTLQDVSVWSHKQFAPRPRLCRSDGEIMLYRKYCAQFYPAPDELDDTDS